VTYIVAMKLVAAVFSVFLAAGCAVSMQTPAAPPPMPAATPAPPPPEYEMTVVEKAPPVARPATAVNAAQPTNVAAGRKEALVTIGRRVSR
jgi:hypothetical protein